VQSWSRITCWIEVTRHTYLVLCLGAHDTLTVISWSSHCTATRFDPRLDRLVVVLHWGATGHNISSSLSKHSGVRSAGLGRGYPIKDSNLFFLTSLLDASLDLYLFFLYIYNCFSVYTECSHTLSIGSVLPSTCEIQSGDENVGWRVGWKLVVPQASSARFNRLSRQGQPAWLLNPHVQGVRGVLSHISGDVHAWQAAKSCSSAPAPFAPRHGSSPPLL